MKDNGMDIPIQNRYARLGTSSRPLSKEEYFQIHWWEAVDTYFAFYTKKELRTVRSNFEDPLVKTLEMI